MKKEITIRDLFDFLDEASLTMPDGFEIVMEFLNPTALQELNSICYMELK